MRIRTFVIAAAGLAMVATTPAAYAIGIGAGFKAKKVAGDLVPAFKPADTPSNSGEDSDAVPANVAFNEAAAQRQTACTFAKGAVKIQVGKDASVKLSSVICGGVPYSGNLCAQVKSLSTIANEEIDKTGASTPTTCVVNPTAGDIAGKINWVTTQIGQVVCAAGKCAGTLPSVTSDPCPSVDKITEIRRVDVMNGPAQGTLSILGATLTACCGPGQTSVGPIGIGTLPACTAAPTQDVMATMGNVTEGVAP